MNTKRKLSYAHNVKIFDKNNPNIKILNTNESIISLFDSGAVPIEYCKTPEDNEIIGYISKVGEFVGSELFGDITFWGEEYSNYEFRNYCIEIDGQGNKDNKEYFISRIVCVEFQPKPLLKSVPNEI